MRTYDLSPLYRATVGFDRMADLLDRVLTQDTAPSTYPPYNIEKTADDAYRISIAVAGFTDAELSVEQREAELVVAARKGQGRDAAHLPASRHRHPRLRKAVPAGRSCARDGRCP
jgi:molecular chaperone IbpA